MQETAYKREGCIPYLTPAAGRPGREKPARQREPVQRGRDWPEETRPTRASDPGSRHPAAPGMGSALREPPTVGAPPKIPAERSRVRVGHPATEGTGSTAARPVSKPENYILHSPRQPETGRGHGRPVSELYF